MADEPAGYSINVESGNIVVQHTGRLTAQAIEASRREVAELAAERHLSGILLDLSPATSSLPFIDIFELGSGQGSVLPPSVVVAVVYRPDQFSAEDIDFAEDISLNRGIQMRAFTDSETAQQWLLDHRRPMPG